MVDNPGGTTPLFDVNKLGLVLFLKYNPILFYIYIYIHTHTNQDANSKEHVFSLNTRSNLVLEF